MMSSIWYTKYRGVTLGVTDHGDAEQNPNDVAVPVEAALLDVVVKKLVVDESLQVLVIVVQVVGVSDVPECSLEQLAFLIADAFAEGPVHLQPPTVQTHKRHTDGRRLEGAPEAALALLERFLGVLLLRDIEAYAQEIVATGEVEQLGGAQDGAFLAGFNAKPDFHTIDPAPRAHDLDELVPVFGRNPYPHLRRGAVQKLLPPIANDLQGSGVDVDEPSVVTP